jgi:hypothetical protein
MTHQERIELIREIKELLQMQEESRNSAQGKMFDEDTIKLMKSVLQKCLGLSA